MKGKRNDDPTSPRSNEEINNFKNNPIFQLENSGGQDQIYGSPYYTDNFDDTNDTTSLKSRGYKIYYRGAGIQGPAPVWFQGGLFASFNGPYTGYVAANYQVVNSINNIDSWLVLPKKSVTTGDSLIFYARSDLASIQPDSIRVMYSAVGDSTPESSWTELGRFKTITNGTWERKGFRAGSSGANARFAIRYNVVNSGPAGTNGNYIGIDALSIEGPNIANDMAAVSVNSPSSPITLPSSVIAPKASFKNNGTSGQINIPVTYSITGPVNYTSNKIIASLSAGITTQVIFDSTFNPLPGTYTITIYSGLVTDGNRYNDTVRSTFTANDPNYGNAGTYYYANSTTGALPAPSQPAFCWKDTSGSISLEANTVNLQQSITTGDLDDGYWKVLIPSGKKVKFFGSNYDTIRIGTNGIIAFQSFVPDQSNWGPPTDGIPGGAVLNAIYPLWNDFDFSDNTASATSRISYKVSGNLLIITYDRAPVYSAHPGEYISFQVSIDVSAAPSTNSRILIQYADTAAGKTGQAFVNDVNNNSLSRHLIGLQNSGGNSAFTYRFKNASTLITTGKIFNSPLGNLALQIGPDAGLLNNSCFALNLTSRLQAIQLTRKDTLTVTVRQNVSPYAVVESKKVVYDSTDGTSFVPLNLVQNGTSYYIQVSHRNSIPTWSSAPVLCNSNVMTYDFTPAVTQAFGNNMIIVSGKASYFAGDVTGDKCINLADIVQIFNDATTFPSGNYLIDDLNYDGIVNLTDLVLAFNNSSLFICEMQPAGPVANSFVPTEVDFNYSKDIMPQSSINKKEWIRRFGK